MLITSVVVCLLNTWKLTSVDVRSSKDFGGLKRRKERKRLFGCFLSDYAPTYVCVLNLTVRAFHLKQAFIIPSALRCGLQFHDDDRSADLSNWPAKLRPADGKSKRRLSNLISQTNELKKHRKPIERKQILINLYLQLNYFLFNRLITGLFRIM